MKKTMCELFAGVGGFRLGFSDWDTVWYNQWEPSQKTQYAHGCYQYHFGTCLDKKGKDTTNLDIEKVKKEDIPDFTLLIGGFPCLAGDTMVLTDTGYQKLISIKPGTMVLSHDGKYHKVLNFFPQGRRDVYEIKADAMPSLILTENHRLYAKFSRGEEPRWMSVSEMLESEKIIYLGVPLLEISMKERMDHTSPKSFYDSLFYLQGKCHRSFPVLEGHHISLLKETHSFCEGSLLWYPITSITKRKEKEEVYDIEVEDSHSFVANNCLSHNCQDYSVASTLATSKGLEGKKGVLWWSIREILEVKKPPFVLLENVDRLLKSPAKQKGRDFAIILACFRDAGYSVEWRVINAADYGYPQRRKRVFIYATRKDMYYSSIEKILYSKGFFAETFPVKQGEKEIHTGKLPEKIGEISKDFSFSFKNTGFMKEGKIYTTKTSPDYSGEKKTLGDILEEEEVDEKFFIPEEKLYYTSPDVNRADETRELLPKECRKTWQYIKGGKKFSRTAKDGTPYTYSEGPVPMIDVWDKSARTLITSEGTFGRTTHIVKDKVSGKIRLLTPKECERIQGFPDDHTLIYQTEKGIKTIPDNKRRFLMGNALVVGLVREMAKTLSKIIDSYD